ncbi:hypothetical protein COOONC_23461 [Cooperia oncophora]
MMLAGSKSDGTDLHSVVANQLKIDRNQAKALNYSRMYGAGEINATKTLSQAGMTIDQARKTAKELFAVTKGTESSWKMLRKEAQPLLLKFVADRKLDGLGNYLTVDDNDMRWVLLRFTVHFKIPYYGRNVQNWIISLVAEKKPDIPHANIVCSLYDDYSTVVRLFNVNPATFNYLEMQTHREVLRTPVLDCRLSDSLSALPKDTPDIWSFKSKYKRSTMNWVRSMIRASKNRFIVSN